MRVFGVIFLVSTVSSFVYSHKNYPRPVGTLGMSLFAAMVISGSVLAVNAI